MSSFSEPLTLELLPERVQGRIVWRTTRPLTYELGMKGSGITVTVPAGWITDLATIPRFLWWLYPPYDPDYAAPAVIHDFLCECRAFDRALTDCILWDAMWSHGRSRFKCWTIYKAVRLFALWCKFSKKPRPALNPPPHPFLK